MDFKLIETTFGTFMVPTSSPVFLQKMKRGGFELGKLRWFMKASRKYFPNPWERNRTFIDVGAHIGSTIIPAFADEGVKKGIAIEPNPINAACLNASLTLSLGHGLVDVHNAIAHEWSGTPQLLSINPHHHGDHRVDGPDDWEQVAVRTVALDDIVEGHPGWVWIDVQGHEAFVLEGMTGLMTKYQFPIVLELFPIALKNKQRFIEIIQQFFTSFIDIKRTGQVLPVEDLPGLIEDMEAKMVSHPSIHTDLFLLP